MSKVFPREYQITALPRGVVACLVGDPRAEDGSVLKWAGPWPVPAIGTEVTLPMNALGRGRVEYYFVEADWLGVMVRLQTLPPWLVRQKEGTRFPEFVCVFGNEIHLP